jgi:hypothetical protein
MKITLSQVEVTDVEVDLPDECPRCHADLTEPGSLFEDSLMGSQISCYRTKDAIAYDGLREHIPDIDLVVGYRCVKCAAVIVSTEEKPYAAEDH